MSAREPAAAFGPGLPPAGGWKLAMHEDPTEYSPEFQDEYRRLWHEAAVERDRLREALVKIAHTDEVRLTETPAQIAANALEAS
jgi:hypothetical protein